MAPSTRRAGSGQRTKKISQVKQGTGRNARQYCQQAMKQKSNNNKNRIHSTSTSTTEWKTKIEAMVRVNLWRQFLFAAFCLTYTVFNFGCPCPCQRGVHKNAFSDTFFYFSATFLPLFLFFSALSAHFFLLGTCKFHFKTVVFLIAYSSSQARSIADKLRWYITVYFNIFSFAIFMQFIFITLP